jgi:hypothetical protein
MTTTSLDTGTTPATDAIRLLVEDVLLSVTAEDDPDRYSSRTPAGQALLSLATLARRAVAALSAEAEPLLDAPGTAVQRELGAAARLLGEAAEAAHREPWQITDLLVRAERLQAQLAASGG